MLKRRPTAEPAPAPAAEPVAAVPPKPGGKGRPTPKRREAEKRRPPVAPPQTRREAMARQRELVKAQRAKQRAALRTGDAKDLPLRDRGPEKALVRDLVDSRRNVGVLLLPAAAAILLGQLGGTQVRAAAFSVWLSIVLLMIVDSVVVGRVIARTVKARFPDSEVRTRRLVAYGIQRSTAFRRLRLPPPRVQPGERV